MSSCLFTFDGNSFKVNLAQCWRHKDHCEHLHFLEDLINLIFIFIFSLIVRTASCCIFWDYVLISLPAALKYDVIIIVREQLDLFSIKFDVNSCLKARFKQLEDSTKSDMCQSPRPHSVKYRKVCFVLLLLFCFFYCTSLVSKFHFVNVIKQPPLVGNIIRDENVRKQCNTVN